MRNNLFTKKGSKINRSSKYGVGKSIGNQLYVHKQYADRVNGELYNKALEILAQSPFKDFKFNTVVFDKTKPNSIRLDSAKGFDIEREPLVGDYLWINTEDSTIKQGKSNYIWHHKWCWVDDDYQGFNVDDSYNWSKEWLGKLDEPADGNGLGRWNTQLDKYNLKHDVMNENIVRNLIKEALTEIGQKHTSRDTSINYQVNRLPATASNKHFIKDMQGKEGGSVLDLGCGKNNSKLGITPFAKHLNDTYKVKTLSFDVYNQEEENNRKVYLALQQGGVDVVTCNNVLNVIDNDEMVENIILQAAQSLKPDGVAYFKLYVNPKGVAGEVASKKDNWQRFADAHKYADFVKKYFKDVNIPSKEYIIAREPIVNDLESVWNVNGDKGWDEGDHLLKMKYNRLEENYIRNIIREAILKEMDDDEQDLSNDIYLANGNGEENSEDVDADKPLKRHFRQATTRSADFSDTPTRGNEINQGEDWGVSNRFEKLSPQEELNLAIANNADQRTIDFLKAKVQDYIGSNNYYRGMGLDMSLKQKEVDNRKTDDFATELKTRLQSYFDNGDIDEMTAKEIYRDYVLRFKTPTEVIKRLRDTLLNN